jgi:hypothetical protein
MKEFKPTWTTSSFLVYAGGFTVLFTALASLGYLASQYGPGAFAAWAFLVLAILYVLAHAFRLRGARVAAGIFALVALAAWAVFVGALWSWFGWLHGSFDDFSLGRLSLELLILAAALDDRRRFGFPLLRLVSAVVAWIFVLDLLSSGGTWSVVVTLLMGLVFFVAAIASDKPSAFWLHLMAGLLVGGSLLHWLHSANWQWWLIAVIALLYVGIANATNRSSWAVLGALGLTFAATHFSIAWSKPGTPSGFTHLTTTSPPLTHQPFPTNSLGPLQSGTQILMLGTPAVRVWVPLVVFAVLGFGLVFLGLLANRRRGAATAGPPAV